MYRALYRKWRPQRFEDVVGQKAIVTALKNQITAGRVGHAYLFTGVRGTGKTTCAKIFAKAVNCLAPQDGDPCGECAVCRGIDNGSILDVVEMDAASNNGVDDIRDLRDETAYTPSTCKYKVYIIDEVHMLSTPAFNALLKTLEEPPAHVIFILATTEIQKVPATILSRCQRYDFTRIRPEDIAGRVAQVAQAEQLDVTPGAADLIARLADGAMRDALSILDTCAGVASHIDEEVVRRMAGVTDKSYLFRISDAVTAGSSSAALAQLAELRQQSVDMKRLTEELIGHYRNLMLAALPGGRELLTGVAPEEETRYLEGAQALGQAEAIRAIRMLGGALEKMTRGNNQRIELELALFALTEPPLAAPPAEQAPRPAAPTQAVPARPFTAAPIQPFAASPVQQPAMQAEAPGSEVPPQPSAEAAKALAPVPAASAENAAKKPEAETPPWENEMQEQAENAAQPQAGNEQEAPPPADEDAPVAAGEGLPWDEQPLTPREVPPKAPQQQPAPPDTAAQMPPQALQAAPACAAESGRLTKFAEWEKVIKVLEERDPMLFGTLKRSKAYYDGKRVLIDGGMMFRDFIRTNKDSQKLIKKVIAEVAGVNCGIGPYEPQTAAQAQRGNAEQVLEALEKKGLSVVIQDNSKSTLKS